MAGAFIDGALNRETCHWNRKLNDHTFLDSPARNKRNKTYAIGGKGGGGNKKTVDAATALGLGARPQSTILCAW